MFANFPGELFCLTDLLNQIIYKNGNYLLHATFIFYKL